MSFASSLSAIVSALAEAAVILVALLVVRPRRPDAYGYVVAGAGMHLFVTLAFPSFAELADRIATMGTIRLAYGAVQVGAALARAVGWGLLAVGVAHLSGSPPPPPLFPPDP